MNADLEAARQVKDQVRQLLAGDERLRGVGLARVDDPVGSYAVVVRVSHSAHVAELALPERVDGVAVQVLVVGDVVALAADDADDSGDGEDEDDAEPAEPRTEPSGAAPYGAERSPAAGDGRPETAG